MKIKILLTFSAISFLLSCASQYQPSSVFQTELNNMTEKKAYVTALRNMTPSDQQAGLCSASTTSLAPKATFVEMKESRVLFDSIITSVASSKAGGNFVAGTGWVVLSYKNDIARFSIDLKTLKKIRVKTEASQQSCIHSKDGYLIFLHADNAPDVMINVSSENFNSFLASLSYLSPSAKLIEGLGL